jgi:site-specific DNA-cytosine methylase
MNIEFKKLKVVEKVELALGKLDALTKRLKVMSVSAASSKRKVVISSKDLIVSGMPSGAKVVVEAKNEGITVRLASFGDAKTRLISSRTYANRAGVEPVLDIRHQELLDKALGNAMHVQVIFKKNEILIEPVYSHKQLANGDVKAVSIDIGKAKDGLYEGVIAAIRVIKQRKFTYIAIDAETPFFDSHECTLFSIQLRRLGYVLSFNDKRQLVANLSDNAVTPDAVEKYIIKNRPQKAVLDAVAFDYSDPLSTFTVCTGGVDVSALEADGFVNYMALDYRPPEKRDYKKSIKNGVENIILNDKTDVGLMSCIINSPNTKIGFNQDIYGFDYQRVTRSMTGLLKPFNFMHASLLCDDFSSLKNKRERLKALDSLETTADMFFELLTLIEQTEVPVVLTENVRNFNNSIEALLFEAGLRAMGYRFFKRVLNATEHGGMTGRQRCYIFATKLDSPFRFPDTVPQTGNAWSDVILPRWSQLREVSHCKSVVKGVETGRIRTISPYQRSSPVITRSQSRQTKDSIYLNANGRFYMPSNDMLMSLMGFVEGFDLTAFSAEDATEIIGQSIDVPMHRSLCREIKQHILDYISCVKSNVLEKIKVSVDTPAKQCVEQQLCLAF